VDERQLQVSLIMGYDELFRRDNGASEFYFKYYDTYKHHIECQAFTLPIAAAYNAGFDEGYKKARNELWHTLQTKND
jgi:hypothetical protein